MSPEYFVFDGDSGAGVLPYRPSLDDVGGAAKEDDQAFPPDPVTMPTAADWNQIARLVTAYGAVCPLFAARIDVGAGTRAFEHIATVAPDKIDDVSLTLTATGTGVTTIEWASGTMPDHYIATVTPVTSSAVHATVTFGVNSLVVRTFDAAGAAVDCDFCVEVR